jgi:hypothetical protein
MNGSSRPAANPQEKTTQPSSTLRPVSSNSSSREIFNAHPEVVVHLQIIDNHVAKVMHIHNHFANSKLAQARKRNLQQRSPPTSTSALGRSSVSGRNRVPSPAARIIAFIAQASPTGRGAVHLSS